MAKTTLAQRIKDRLETLELTQEELARKAVMYPAGISRLLRGKQLSIEAETAERLAEVLRVRPAWLLFGEMPMSVPDTSIDRALALFQDEGKGSRLPWRNSTIDYARFLQYKGKKLTAAEWLEEFDRIENMLKDTFDEDITGIHNVRQLMPRSE